MAKERPTGLNLLDKVYPPAQGDPRANGRFQVVNREKIDPNPFQPRKKFDEAELISLGESMFRHGQIQPVVLRQHPKAPGRYQLIAGERRFRASEPRTGFEGLSVLNAIVRTATDDEMADLAFIENVQRVDLTPAEEVAQVRSLRARGYNNTQIGEVLNKPASWIANRMRVTELPDDLAWLLDHPGTLVMAAEVNKLDKGRLRTDTISFIRSRIEKSGGISLSDVREFISLRLPLDSRKKPETRGITLGLPGSGESFGQGRSIAQVDLQTGEVLSENAPEGVADDDEDRAERQALPPLSSEPIFTPQQPVNHRSYMQTVIPPENKIKGAAQYLEEATQEVLSGMAGMVFYSGIRHDLSRMEAAIKALRDKFEPHG